MGYIGLYNRKPNENVYEAEKQKEKDRKKKFKLVKRYKNFDLYEHKKYGYKECFYK